jgi:3-hydroxybutyrate dehydrogenase
MSILKGKTAVVTGSTSGIGLACARAFAGVGANIVLNGMGAPVDVEKERSAIERDFGVKTIYSPARHGKADRNRQADRAWRNNLRQGRRPRQQCRHPARLSH